MLEHRSGLQLQRLGAESLELGCLGAGSALGHGQSLTLAVYGTRGSTRRQPVVARVVDDGGQCCVNVALPSPERQADAGFGKNVWWVWSDENISKHARAAAAAAHELLSQ